MNMNYNFFKAIKLTDTGTNTQQQKNNSHLGNLLNYLMIKKPGLQVF